MSYIRNKWEELDNQIVGGFDNFKETYILKTQSFPVAFTKGIAAHGYGGDHKGQSSADQLNFLNETVSVKKNADDLTKRYYTGWVNKFGDFGVAIGAADANSNKITDGTKYKFSDDSTSEISISDSLINGEARGGWYTPEHGYVQSHILENLVKYNYADDTTSDSGITTRKAHEDIFWTDWKRNIGFYAAEEDADDFRKIDFSTESVIQLGKAHHMGDRDNVWTSFKDYSIGTISGISGSFNTTDNRLQYVDFINYNFIVLSTFSYQSGEITTLSGPSAYSTGGYGSGGQNAVTQALEYDTGVSRMLPSQSYPRSSGAGYQ